MKGLSMLRAVTGFAFLALVAGPAFGGTEEELRALEEKRRAAIRAKDFATLSEIYAPSFLAVAGNGQMIDRARLFEVFANGDPGLSFATDEIRILDQGETAIFFGRLVASSAKGEPLFSSRFSHVFVRKDGKWHCVAGQSTPIPPPSPQG